jgi:(p)ppGpp synthase/HD superfamily hydrolase
VYHNTLGPEFESVIWFAYNAHSGQMRKFGNEPYIYHPIRVALDVQRLNGTEAQIKAALLHDILEDTKKTYADVVDIAGKEAADIVVELTDVYTPKAYPDWGREKRKVMEAIRLRDISEKAKLVKVCDIWDNSDSVLRGIFQRPSFVMMYLREKIEVLESLGFK